jgi:uracil phosphoribosyltransferase
MSNTLHVLPQTNQLRASHTIIRTRDARRAEFVVHSGRIIRRLVEAGLDHLPHESHRVRTPVGETYEGMRITPAICGVSIARAGESMEAELRTICPEVRIGKILIQRDKVTKLPQLYYSALPTDIARRHVLLLDPMLATGGTAVAAIQVLRGAGVPERDIVFVTLLAAPEGVAVVRERHPEVRIVTSAVERGLNGDAFMMPGVGDFGDRYFGTERPPVRMRRAA